MKNTYNSKGRNTLLDFLKNNKKSEILISEIVEVLKAEGVGESTVYRQVSKLCDEGILGRVSGKDGKSVLYRFIDKESGCHNHFHLKCTNCGNITHLHCDHTGDFRNHIENQHGFSVDFGHTIIYGVCKDCKESV